MGSVMPSRPVELLIRGNDVLRRVLYRSTRATRLLTGLDLEPARSTTYFELGTLAMARALRDVLRPGMRVADVGTGPYAILSLWALRRWDLDVVASEVHPPWVEHARRMAERNGLTLDVRCCDLLSDVEPGLDVTWFVPPFIPEAVFARELEMAGLDDPVAAEELRLRTCGGVEGWELVDRWFAQAAERLAPGGRAITVVNEAHLPSQSLVDLAAQRGFGPPNTSGLPGLPYRVLDFGLA